MVNEALLLEKLDHLATLIEVQISGGKFAAPEDQYYSISATQGFYLDYKKRKHVYLYSPLAFTILLPDLGATASIAANSWTDISFRQGMQLFASAAQTTAVLVLVRATDETISSASTGVSVLNGNVNGQATMANSSPVVIASDQTTINVADATLATDMTELLTDTDNLAGIKTDTDTIVPGVQGWIGATGTGTASQDDSLTFANQVRKVVLYNASSNAVPFEFDQTSAATSIPIQPGQYMVFDNVLCTVVHVFPSATLPINTTAGLYVKGWK